MKSSLCLLLPVVAIAGCALLPLPQQQQEPPTAKLHLAYVAMKQAVAINADAVDAADMGDARQRYRHAYQLRESDPDAAARLAEQSQVLAELAQARTQAALALQQRKAAQLEVSTLEQMAHPGKSSR